MINLDSGVAEGQCRWSPAICLANAKAGNVAAQIFG